MNKEALEKRKKLIVELLEDEMYVPMKEKELAMFLQVSKEDRDNLRLVLNELLAEGKISLSQKGKYVKAQPHIFQGTFISHAKGFGFVEVEGQEEDFYVPEQYVNGAFHKDTVLVDLLPKNGGKRQEVKVVSIVSRGMTQVVGTFQKANKGFGFVVPDNTKIAGDVFVPVERSKGAVDGHKVVVEITDYGKNNKNPEGKVVEILGHVNDPGVDILSIIKGFDLPLEFPEKVLNQAERVAKDVSDADMAGRKDLRELMMVTIDGEDAKDLDDAVSLYEDEEGYHLGVHIADVTNYVQENSALDREALKRGTSVYLVDRVIPMLPHVLSNGICSLNEGVDRLALSCLMTIDKKGNVTDHTIAESVICVNKRMSYTQVNRILIDEDKEFETEYPELTAMFVKMKELADILRAKRHKRGSIDFDFPETKIILDSDGHPVDIKPYERNAATKIIEDFMLIANETVAEHFFWLESPFVYRTHEFPDLEKIERLRLFIKNYGYNLKVSQDEIHPKELQKLLGSIEGTPEEVMISRLTLRSMKQAKYGTECTGHFGLACQYYCHFTSPIRRYPDLQIHRIIKETLRGKMSHSRLDHYRSILFEVSKHSSQTERRAEEAERETDKKKKAEYMEDHIGEIFDGVVSGITAWGMYVELENTVEGLVHISTIPGDYFVFDEKNYELVGKDFGKKYLLGQRVVVKVKGVDRMIGTVDFTILDEDEN